MELRGHRGWVASASFSPDGTRVMTASMDNNVRIWNVLTATPVVQLDMHDVGTAVLHSASFSPDGTRIVTASADRLACVWDATTGVELASLLAATDHDEHVRFAAFSPDSTRIVTASSDVVRVWDAVTGMLILEFGARSGGIYSAAFAPDGTRIVTASADSIVRVWDSATGSMLAQLRGHAGAVRSTAFSPDGTRIVTASADTTARVWDSVPYAERYGARQLALAARKASAPRVDALEAHLGDWSPVAAALRADTSLDDDIRWEALNEVLRRASADAKLAETTVQRFVSESVLSDRVVERLESEAGLESQVRTLAIKRARAIGDEPLRLNNAAWQIVSRSGADAARYAVAVEAASRAVAGEPDNGYYVNTLGVALYRLGRYEQALATLMHSDELNRRTEAPHNRNRRIATSNPEQAERAARAGRQAGQDLGSPYDTAFIAMALDKLGRRDEARVALDRLHALVRQDVWSNDKDVVPFVREAETLILGATTP